MKSVLLLLLTICAAQAAPVVSEIEWRSACDGATIDVVADGGRTMSVRAKAIHSAVVIEWTIHYLDGHPVSAEFRESERGRVTEGENAGDYTGVDRLKRLKTFKWQGERFLIEDKALREELEDILTKVQTARDKGPSPKSSD